MNKLLFILFLISINSFGQNKATQPVINSSGSESVFKDISIGGFEGTANGVLLAKDSKGKSLILDFQGSSLYLDLKVDEYEVYDVSWKNYVAYTTSGKTKIEYVTYAKANSLSITLPTGVFKAGTIDGACDAMIDGLSYFYKSETNTEYLILRVDKQIEMRYESDGSGQRGQTKNSLYLEPNSTLVFAVSRN